MNYIDKTKLLLINGAVCDWVVANSAVLCNRKSFYTCSKLLWFPFCKAFFPLNLCFSLPHVCFPFVHLPKIKAQSTVRGSFECGRAQKPVSISKHGFVCSGLCVLCLFQFFFPFYPPTSPTTPNIEQCAYTKTWRFSRVQITLNVVCFLRQFSSLKFQWGTSRFDLCSDTFCSVLLCPFLPSYPNTVIGILHGTAYIRCNTEISFSFTPLSQTLPYK